MVTLKTRPPNRISSGSSAAMVSSRTRDPASTEYRTIRRLWVSLLTVGLLRSAALRARWKRPTGGVSPTVPRQREPTSVRSGGCPRRRDHQHRVGVGEPAHHGRTGVFGGHQHL